MNREKGIFLFSVIIVFLKTPICLSFLTSGLRLFHLFIQYRKNVFQNVFEGMGFILVLNADLKG